MDIKITLVRPSREVTTVFLANQTKTDLKEYAQHFLNDPVLGPLVTKLNAGSIKEVAQRLDWEITWEIIR